MSNEIKIPVQIKVPVQIKNVIDVIISRKFDENTPYVSANNIHGFFKSLEEASTKLKFDGNGFGIIMELVP